jgi:hypothetical protein
MSFTQLKRVCDELRTRLREVTGRQLIDVVSLDEPNGPEDELHFFKLVSWCYVFIFEASHPAVRYILSLLRTANPEEHKTVSLTFDVVNNLRTVRVHNLSPESKRDDYRKRQADIWLVQNGGEPPDWPSCCRSLGSEVSSAIRRLTEKWVQITANKEDAAAVISELIITIDREWPPNAFDRMIEKAADDIGLSGLDCAKYRESRLARWRELTGFFENREHAEAAMSAAIRRELELLFGSHASKVAAMIN